LSCDIVVEVYSPIFMFVSHSHYHNFLCREETSTVSEEKDYGISNSATGAEPVVHSDHIVPPVEEVPKEEALSNTETHQIAYGQEAPLSVFGLVPSLSAIGQPVNTEAAETQVCGISCHSICTLNNPCIYSLLFR